MRTDRHDEDFRSSANAPKDYCSEKCHVTIGLDLQVDIKQVSP